MEAMTVDERDQAELEWWRQSFVCRFGPNNLPHVGEALLGYRFHLFYDHPDDGLLRWGDTHRPRR